MHEETMEGTVDPFRSRSTPLEDERDVISCYLVAYQCKSIDVEDRFASGDSTNSLEDENDGVYEPLHLYG